MRVLRAVVMAMAVGVLALAVAGCGGDSDDDQATPDDLGIDTSGDESGDDPGGDGDAAGGDAEMPPELADFPLPDDATMPFPATYNDADVDPRETLVATLNSSSSYDEVVQVVGDGLAESDAYTVESEEIQATAAWEFTKDGLPGNVTVGESPAGIVININLFMSGTR